jgi:hypothetical protein
MWEQDSGLSGRATARWTPPYSSNIADGQTQMRRAQQDERDDEAATNKQLTKQAEEHADTTQPGGGQASGGGISSDSACPFASNNLDVA